MNKLGFERAQIAHWIGHDERTVKLWIDHFEQHGTVEDRPRSGCPRESTEELDQAIVSVAERERFITPKGIRTELEAPLSARTVRRRLDEAGLFGRVARVLYPFTEEHIQLRLKFADDYSGFDDDDWSRVVFSDETHFVLGGSGQVWV